MDIVTKCLFVLETAFNLIQQFIQINEKIGQEYYKICEKHNPSMVLNIPIFRVAIWKRNNVYFGELKTFNPLWEAKPWQGDILFWG